MLRSLLLASLALSASVAPVARAAGPADAPAKPRPNIIYVLADDLGFGDLSCYGQQTLRTPNLDRMAADGLRFTRHYSGSTVCAPSRCVLMTGLHTGHCRVRGNGPGQLTADDVCFPELLQRAGYATGAFGKWGIGNPPPLDDPQRHGFDTFFGYINMFHAHNYYPEFLIRDGRKVPLRNRLYPDWKQKRTGPREGAGVAETAVDYAPRLIADAALDYIRANKDRPFFLYYALNIPHANNEGGGETRIARNGMRVPEFKEFAKQSWPDQEKGFARMIRMIDNDMGRILSLLRELQLDQQTLVLFSSDNGPHQEGGHQMEHFNSNGPLRGMKRDLYEGGVRVPLIAWQPGAVPAGETTDVLSGFQDMFPTLLDVARVSTEHPTDGISLLSTLTGEPRTTSHNELYFEFLEQGGKRALIQTRWKAVQRDTGKRQPLPIELYDLQADPSEKRDVAADHPDIVATMRLSMRRSRTAAQ